MGNADNLNAFLDVNPKIPRDMVLADASKTCDAYNAVGFKKIFEVTPRKGIAKPNLTGDEWWGYLKNLFKVTPFVNEKDNAATNEAVRRLGGTFALDGANVLYSWSDSVPGDHPDPKDVLAESGLLKA